MELLKHLYAEIDHINYRLAYNDDLTDEELGIADVNVDHLWRLIESSGLMKYKWVRNTTKKLLVKKTSRYSEILRKIKLTFWFACIFIVSAVILAFKKGKEAIHKAIEHAKSKLNSQGFVNLPDVNETELEAALNLS